MSSGTGIDRDDKKMFKLSQSTFYIKNYSFDIFSIFIYISAPLISNNKLKVNFLGPENLLRDIRSLE